MDAEKNIAQRCDLILDLLGCYFKRDRELKKDLSSRLTELSDRLDDYILATQKLIDEKVRE